MMANYACGFPHVMPTPAAGAGSCAVFVRFSGVVVCTSRTNVRTYVRTYFLLKFTCTEVNIICTYVDIGYRFSAFSIYCINSTIRHCDYDTVCGIMVHMWVYCCFRLTLKHRIYIQSREFVILTYASDYE